MHHSKGEAQEDTDSRVFTLCCGELSVRFRIYIGAARQMNRLIHYTISNGNCTALTAVNKGGLWNMKRPHAARSGVVCCRPLLLRCGLIVWEAESAYMLGRIFHSNVQPVLPVNPTCLEIFKFESCITKPRAESHSLDLNKYVLYWPRQHRIRCICVVLIAGPMRMTFVRAHVRTLYSLEFRVVSVSTANLIQSWHLSSR